MDQIIIRELIPLLKLLENRGVNVTNFLWSEGISPESVLNPDTRIDSQKLESITSTATQITGDENIGLRQGEIFGLYSNVPFFILTNCNDLCEALYRYLTYQKIADETKQVKIETNYDSAKILIETYSSGNSWSRHLSDAGLSTIYSFLKLITRKEIWLDRVKFRHPEPSDLPEYTRFFKCRPEFSTDEDSISFKIKYLKSKIYLNSKNKLESIHKKIIDITDTLPLENFSRTVSRVIAENLPGTLPSAEIAARRLAVSTDMMNQRLKDEENDYRLILDSVRLKSALCYLNDMTLSIVDIAYLLGFSDVESLEKFIKYKTELNTIDYRPKKK